MTPAATKRRRRRNPDPQARRRERDVPLGGPAIGARVLVDRMRAGELSRERVALAAQAGDPAARLVVEAPLNSRRDQLIASAWDAMGFGETTLWAADCAERAVNAVADQLPPELLGGDLSGLRGVIHTVRAWIIYTDADMSAESGRARTVFEAVRRVAITSVQSLADANDAVHWLMQACRDHLNGVFQGHAPFGPPERTQAALVNSTTRADQALGWGVVTTEYYHLSPWQSQRLIDWALGVANEDTVAEAMRASQNPPRRHRAGNLPLRAFFGDERIPVQILKPTQPKDYRYWTVQFPEGEVYTVPATSLFTRTGLQWRPVPPVTPGRQAWANPSDDRLRRLERAAALGDPSAPARLRADRIRTTGKVPPSHQIPMAVHGVFTPSGRVLCLDCDPRDHPQQWAAGAGEGANARCDQCGIPVYLERDDVAMLQQLRDDLRVRGVHAFNVWQTGGMCAALGTMLNPSVEFIVSMDFECQTFVQAPDRILAWPGDLHPAAVSYPGAVMHGTPWHQVPTGSLTWYVGIMDQEGDDLASQEFTTRTVSEAGERIARQYKRAIVAFGTPPAATNPADERLRAAERGPDRERLVIEKVRAGLPLNADELEPAIRFWLDQWPEKWGRRPYESGGPTFYTQAEWRERGERWGNEMPVVMTAEGGLNRDLDDYHPDLHEFQEGFRTFLARHGWGMESLASWAFGFYKDA